jgi:hypothetical protein
MYLIVCQLADPVSAQTVTEENALTDLQLFYYNALLLKP